MSIETGVNHGDDYLWVTVTHVDGTVKAQTLARYLHDAATDALNEIGTIDQADAEMREDLLEAMRSSFDYLR